MVTQLGYKWASVRSLIILANAKESYPNPIRKQTYLGDKPRQCKS